MMTSLIVVSLLLSLKTAVPLTEQYVQAHTHISSLLGECPTPAPTKKFARKLETIWKIVFVLPLRTCVPIDGVSGPFISGKKGPLLRKGSVFMKNAFLMKSTFLGKRVHVWISAYLAFMLSRV